MTTSVRDHLPPPHGAATSLDRIFCVCLHPRAPTVAPAPVQVVAVFPALAGRMQGVPKTYEAEPTFSPPLSPPRTPPRKRQPEKQKCWWREEKSRSGKRFFFNEKTGESTYDHPSCLKKYG